MHQADVQYVVKSMERVKFQRVCKFEADIGRTARAARMISDSPAANRILTLIVVNKRMTRRTLTELKTQSVILLWRAHKQHFNFRTWNVRKDEQVFCSFCKKAIDCLGHSTTASTAHRSAHATPYKAKRETMFYLFFPIVTRHYQSVHLAVEETIETN